MLFRVLSKHEKLIVFLFTIDPFHDYHEKMIVPLELRKYSDLSRHIKEPQNGIYCLNFFKKKLQFES